MAVREWKAGGFPGIEVVAGAADRSYGIQVARLAGRRRPPPGPAGAGCAQPLFRHTAHADDLPLCGGAAARKPEATLLMRCSTRSARQLTSRAALDLIYELKKHDAGRRS